MYKIDKNKEFGYAAEFKYNGIDYLLTGTMKQEEFEKILKNLIFSKIKATVFEKLCVLIYEGRKKYEWR